MFTKLLSQYKKTEHWIAIAGGWIFNWIALFVSYKPNPLFEWKDGMPNLNLNDPSTIYATGGFPYKVYDYPQPPLGPGPEQSEIPFFLNFILWTIVAYVLIYVFRKYIPKHFENFVAGLAVIITIFGYMYLLLKFD